MVTNNKLHKHLSLETCPRCHGQVGIEEDSYGFRRVCIQCAWEKDLSNAEVLKLKEVQVK